jgi:hypothetical protein
MNIPVRAELVEALPFSLPGKRTAFDKLRANG